MALAGAPRTGPGTADRGSLIAFRDIDFGRAEARIEGQDEPRLLLDGYLDLHGVFDKVVLGSRYLVLGYKGSGKTALAQHILLRAEQDPDLAARVQPLSSLSTATDFQGAALAADREARYSDEWTWHLLMHLFEAFRGDARSPSRQDSDFQETLQALTLERHLPAQSIADAILDLGKDPAILSDRPRPTSSLVDRLVDLAATFRSPTRHLLVLDGLDDVLEAPNQLSAVSALLKAASQLNRRLQTGGCPAKTVVLCRTDIFNAVPGPDTNKHVQDGAVELTWHTPAGRASESDLVRLLNLKARVSDPAIDDVIQAYPPSKEPPRTLDRGIPVGLHEAHPPGLPAGVPLHQ